ncbi:MAG: hypothetical protein ACK4I8_10345, partial [Armatimonadota bacterium]
RSDGLRSAGTNVGAAGSRFNLEIFKPVTSSLAVAPKFVARFIVAAKRNFGGDGNAKAFALGNRFLGNITSSLGVGR